MAMTILVTGGTGYIGGEVIDQLLARGHSVHTTVREANDRGYECLVLADCVGSYFPEFQRVALEMIKAQGGIFGWVGSSAAAISALRSAASVPA